MCDACAARSAKLQSLIDQFEVLAAEEPDPLTARRLRRAIDDLRVSAAPDGDLCACSGEVVWDDKSAAPEPALG